MAKRTNEVESKTAYERAQDEWKRGRLSAAFRLFLEAAKDGDKDAYRLVAQFHDFGEGTPKDEGQALYWYRRAHRECSDGAAAHNIGCTMRDRGEIDRALWWFRRAVKLGDEEAHLDIAKIHLQRERPIKAMQHLEMLLASSTITEGARGEGEALLSVAGVTSD